LANSDTSRHTEDAHTVVLDESYRLASITVGGFLAATADLPGLAASWRALKVEMGLTASDELKYQISEQHPARAKLDAAGWNQARRVPKILNWIADQPITLLADTLVDWRSSKTARIQELYFNAFDWCLRHAANHVQYDLGSPSGPHTVLVDMPDTAKGVDEANLTALLRQLQDDAGTAAFAHYQQRYLEPQSWPSGLAGKPLAELGFQSELHASHAKHSDLLQIADVVVGCVNDLCSFNLDGFDKENLPTPDYQEANFLVIGCKFRKSLAGQLSGYGIGIFPPDGVAAGRLLEYVESLAAAQ
jgi:hypothetical protein